MQATFLHRLIIDFQFISKFYQLVKEIFLCILITPGPQLKQRFNDFTSSKKEISETRDLQVQRQMKPILFSVPPAPESRFLKRHLTAITTKIKLSNKIKFYRIIEVDVFTYFFLIDNVRRSPKLGPHGHELYGALPRTNCYELLCTRKKLYDQN